MSSLFMPSNFEKLYQNNELELSRLPGESKQGTGTRKKKRSSTLGNQGSDADNPLIRAIQNLVLSAQGRGPEMRMAMDGQEQDVFASPVVPVGPMTSIYGKGQLPRSLVQGGVPMSHGIAREAGINIPSAIGNLVGGAMDTLNERTPEMLRAYSPTLVAKQAFGERKKRRNPGGGGAPPQQMV